MECIYSFTVRFLHVVKNQILLLCSSISLFMIFFNRNYFPCRQHDWQYLDKRLREVSNTKDILLKNCQARTELQILFYIPESYSIFQPRLLNRFKKKKKAFLLLFFFLTIQATKQQFWRLVYSKLRFSLLWVCLPETIYKKMKELYLVENILQRGSKSTKSDCRLQRGAKGKYITTPFYALGCKFEEMQNTWSSLAELSAGNGCAQINPGMIMFQF